MTEAIAKRELPEPVVRRGISEGQWNTLCKTLFPGANPNSVLLVWDYCAVRKLDPMKKPCHIVPMEVRDAKTGKYEWRDVVMPGVYEYRTTAHRTGEYLGHSEPTYGPEIEAYGVKAPEWCGMTVYRWNPEAHVKGEFPVKVFFTEVVATKKNRETGEFRANARWTRAPKQMLTKCFSADTEILTDQGFMLFGDVEESGAHVLQVLHDRLAPVPSKPFVQQYNGPMVTVDSDDLNFCVTPNHDMVTTHGKVEAGVIYTEARSRAKFWIPRRAGHKHFDNQSITDSQIRLAAIYLADGYDKGDDAFEVAVSRPRKIQVLETLAMHASRGRVRSAGQEATGRSGRVVRTRTDKERFRYASSFVRWIAGPSKEVIVAALLSLSARQARVFVDTLIEFDGRMDDVSGVRRFYSSRSQVRRAFELGAVLAGYSINSWSERHSDLSDVPCYSATISDRDAIPVYRRGREFHSSVPPRTTPSSIRLTPPALWDVWCVTVPSGVIVVRRNGFSMLCGNCTEAAGIREAFPEEIGGEPTAEEMDGQRAIDAAVIDVEATVEAAPPSPLEALSDETRASVDKAFQALKLTPGASTMRVNEFLGGDVDPEEGAERLLQWCRDEYRRRQAKAETPDEHANSAKPNAVPKGMKRGSDLAREQAAAKPEPKATPEGPWEPEDITPPVEEMF